MIEKSPKSLWFVGKGQRLDGANLWRCPLLEQGKFLLFLETVSNG